jgi:hypothetical protein
VRTLSGVVVTRGRCRKTAAPPPFFFCQYCCRFTRRHREVEAAEAVEVEAAAVATVAPAAWVVTVAMVVLEAQGEVEVEVAAGSRLCRRSSPVARECHLPGQMRWRFHALFG